MVYTDIASFQVVPHITDAIQEWVETVAHRPVDGDHADPEVCIIELGGTIGDIEGMPFVEAFRQFQFRVKVRRENFVSENQGKELTDKMTKCLWSCLCVNTTNKLTTHSGHSMCVCAVSSFIGLMHRANMKTFFFLLLLL